MKGSELEPVVHIIFITVIFKLLLVSLASFMQMTNDPIA